MILITSWLRRKAGLGECKGGEVALLCRDFLRLGYSKLIVDPGVRLTYTADDARQRYTQKVKPGMSLYHETPGCLTECNCCPSSTHLQRSHALCKKQADGICTS